MVYIVDGIEFLQPLARAQVLSENLLVQIAWCKLEMSLQHRDSESNATEHAIRTWQMSSQHNDSESNATEHAITTWQEQRWRRSKECQHVIILFVSLRLHRNGYVLQPVLGQKLPALLNEANPQEGFFEVLYQGIIDDEKLLKAVIDFIAGWESFDGASLEDLLADEAVSREAAAFLPTTVPLWMWINGRLGRLSEEEDD